MFSYLLPDEMYIDIDFFLSVPMICEFVVAGRRVVSDDTALVFLANFFSACETPSFSKAASESTFESTQPLLPILGTAVL